MKMRISPQLPVLLSCPDKKGYAAPGVDTIGGFSVLDLLGRDQAGIIS